ncbi:hypothetical protein [Haloferax mucosum]|nr:hypothetical protein [Haloferax mucosum]
MSRESEGVTSVSDGEVTVEKTFAADEFPVPAIKFVINSSKDEPTRIRVIDRIPESFPMESVGFHPDFESDNWTAYKDHRVEYERTLDPGEELVTVYGIRITDGQDRTEFLEEPTLERIPADGGIDPEDIDDILGEDRSQLVRDVLAGDRKPVEADADTNAGADASAADDVGEVIDAEAGASTDNTPTDDDLAAAFEADDGRETTAAADETRGESVTDADEPVSHPSSDAEVLDDAADGRDVESTDVDSTAESDAEPETRPDPEPRAVTTDTTPAVTAHLEDPDVDDNADSAHEVTESDDDEADSNDETADTEAVESGADDSTDADSDTSGSTSTNTSTTPTTDTGTVSAAAEGGLVSALAAEIRAGTADESDLDVVREAVDVETRRSTDVRIRRLQSQMEDLEAYSDALAEFIDEEGTGEELVSEFRAEMDAFRADLDALDTVVEDTVESVDDATSRLDAAEETIAAVDERSERVSSTVANAQSHLDDHGDRLESLSSDVHSATDRLESHAGRLDAHGEQFEQYDERLESHDARFDDHDERLDEYDETFERYDERLEDASRNIQAGSARLDSIESTLSEREAEFDTVNERLDSLSTRLDEAAERLEGVERDTSNAQDTAATLHDEVGEIREDIASLDGDIVDTKQSIDSRLSDVQERIEDVATGDDLDALRDDIDDLNETVAELETFRERLAGAFGTGMGGAPEDE